MTRIQFIHQALINMCANPRFFTEDGAGYKRDEYHDDYIIENMVNMAEMLANVAERQGHKFD